MSRAWRAFLAEHFAPLVLVIASPEAEALCALSSLSVVDLLAPHCTAVRANGTGAAWAAQQSSGSLSPPPPAHAGSQ